MDFWIILLIAALCILPNSTAQIDELSKYLIPGTIILPISALGLANRLRILSSIYSIANLRNQTVVVFWRANEDCTAGFYHIFKRSTLINVVDVGPEISDSMFNQYVRNLVQDYAIQNGLVVKEFFPRSFQIGDKWENTGLAIVWTRGTHADITTDCGAYLFSKMQLYQSLIPSQSVKDIVETVSMAPLGGGLVVGVHMRAFDVRHDWAVVSPSLLGTASKRKTKREHRVGSVVSNASMINDSIDSAVIDHNTGGMNNDPDHDEDGGSSSILEDLNAKRFDEAATLDAFIGVMKDLIALHPQIRFFVASNSVTAKHQITLRFGEERIISLDSILDQELAERQSERGIIVAAAEFLLLGKTAFILHTRGSSFAREAAARTSIPVIDIYLQDVENLSPIIYTEISSDGDIAVPPTIPTISTRALYFYSQHQSLPFCAMPEFIRAQYSRSLAKQHDQPLLSQQDQSHHSAQDKQIEEEQQSDRLSDLTNDIKNNIKNNDNKFHQHKLKKVCYREDDRLLCSVAYSVCPCPPHALLYGLQVHGFYCTIPYVSNDDESCISLLAESNGYSV